jgi:hypothetical protein
VANGHGGKRRNAGAPYAAPRAAALRILEAAVAYCTGIAGDPRRQEPLETTWARYLDQVGEAGRRAAATDLPAAVSTSFTMLDRAVSVRIAEDSETGLSALLQALDKGPEVPDRSQLPNIGQDEIALPSDTEQGAPERLSGVPLQEPTQLGLGIGLMIGEDERDCDVLEEARDAANERGRGRAPLPPPGASPLRFEVGPQNLDFSTGLGESQV